MTKATYAPVRDDHEALIASRLAWLVDLLTSPRAPQVDDPGTHFVQAFLDRHPEGVDALLHRWRGAGPFVAESLSPVAHKGWATLVAHDGSRHTLAMTIDTTGKVRRADVEPEVADGVPRTFADVDALLDDEGVRSSALVARKVDGRWESLYEREADRLMPGGSVYKVYLLLALARALESGTVRWDDELVLGPEHRSLPTGEMQDLPDGTRASVYETAYNMFARSDNTASDLVLDLLGRDAVHDAVAASGHANPLRCNRSCRAASCSRSAGDVTTCATAGPPQTGAVATSCCRGSRHRSAPASRTSPRWRTPTGWTGS